MSDMPVPKKKGRSCLTTILILVVVCVVLAGIAVAVVGPSISKLANGMIASTTTAQDFMNTIIAKDYTKAFGMVIAEQQQSFGGSAEGMQKIFTDQNWEPTVFTVTNIGVNNGDAIVNGTGTFGTKTRYVRVDLRQVGDAWKILGFSISDTAPTAAPTP